MTTNPEVNLNLFQSEVSCEIHTDNLMRSIYASDASIYQEMPIGVAYPKTNEEVRALVVSAHKYNIPLIPRSGGTSLSGQCVGNGLVVDVSKYMNSVLEINTAEKWVVVQPGVIRDELNLLLSQHNLYFGPNTSTSNRCTLGGMVGNNSSGSTSIESGTTRDHLLEVKMVLSNGDEVTFGSLTEDEIRFKSQQDDFEGQLYLGMLEILVENATIIKTQYPDETIHRRNQGYALDILLRSQPFGGLELFNMSKLICGSEGTLGMITEIKIQLEDLPNPDVSVLVAHFSALDESLKATIMAMKYGPSKCELMDKIILDCTKENKQQSKNRYFIHGDPAAVLMIEFRPTVTQTSYESAAALAEVFRQNNIGYAFPILNAKEASSVWELRAAGLGLLSNVKGNAKPIACIEDTAVKVEDLYLYIREFQELMQQFKQNPVFYAHAGAGELHLRPIIDLKTEDGQRDLEEICRSSAELVRKYRGTISGEHGDGRVRAPFLEVLVGKEVVYIWEKVKSYWDPDNIFNPNKIVFPKPVTEDLRYKIGENYDEETAYNFKEDGGFMMAVEKCNGSGDCRKTNVTGGTMCPSYKASLEEKDSTRARANALRVFLKSDEKKMNFNADEVIDILDLCLSCKACYSECPSNVDMSLYKSEYYFQYYKNNKRRNRDYIITYFSAFYGYGSYIPFLFNGINKVFGPMIKKMAGFHQGRSLPMLGETTLHRWIRKQPYSEAENGKGRLYLFVDEFTNLVDSSIGIKAVKLLSRLGYEVMTLPNQESGRAALSKGMLDRAKKVAGENVRMYDGKIDALTPLVGIEPSAILSFRHEYPKLLRGQEASAAMLIAEHTFTIEEFLYKEIIAGNIQTNQFDNKPRKVLYHAHCHQGALSDVDKSLFVLSFLENTEVERIASGCCGMAGSFGFEEEHFDLSQKIAAQILVPAVRNRAEDSMVCASGTSCRHQILDSTGTYSLHPVEVLYEALT